MSRRLLISAMPGETRAAWLDDGRLADLLIRRDDRPSVADNVYLGRVRALDKGLEGAFIDIGLARPGLLPLAEAPRGLCEGDALVVRVRGEPSEDKGARLTTKIGPPEPEAARVAAPALLRAAGDPIAAALTAADPPEEIVTDDPATFARAKAAFDGRPDLRDRLMLSPDPAPLFDRDEVEDQIDALLQPHVPLPSGGGLLIEPVRTLTAIDVNSGRHHARAGAAKAALALDLEAAAAIPRQVRLRGLSGLLVVDFLGLDDPDARTRVVKALRAGLAEDPRPTRVHAMRRSGLVEMTRRRAGPALHEILTEPCGIGGTGRVKDPVTLAYHALRAARRAAAAARGRPVAIHGAPRVVAALDGPVKAARTALEERLGRALDLRDDPGRADFETVIG